MKLAIIGTGFVGVTSSVVYASFGNEVVGLDIDEKKVASLRRGKVPFYEPKLAEMLLETQAQGQLSFTDSYQEAISAADVVIVAVGTPSRADGSIDLGYVDQAVAAAAPYFKDGVILAIKSTVLPGTLKRVRSIVEKVTAQKVYYASLPEFLKEGTAVDDTLHPDRIVIGANEKKAREILDELHAPFKAPIIHISPESAQLAKYASNDYLALRIAYINEIADLAEKVGANVDEVLQVMGLEKRIGSHYWYPGFGYGGSCFPKDVRALAAHSGELGENDSLFKKLNELNSERPLKLMRGFEKKVGGFAGKKVAVLGLSFKPHTDDQREAPALSVVPYLLAQGAKVTTFDPMVKAIADPEVIANHNNYQQAESIEAAIENADVVIALVEWPAIVGFDFASLTPKTGAYFIDGRNQFNKKAIEDCAYKYLGIGK